MGGKPGGKVVCPRCKQLVKLHPNHLSGNLRRTLAYHKAPDGKLCDFSGFLFFDSPKK